MSKFWGADSDSDSGSDSGSSSGIGSDAGGGGGKEKRVWAISSSSSDDEGPREVKSAADKAFEALHAKLKDGKNKIKNNDWVGLQEDFEAINKQVKSKSGIMAIRFVLILGRRGGVDGTQGPCKVAEGGTRRQGEERTQGKGEEGGKEGGRSATGGADCEAVP